MSVLKIGNSEFELNAENSYLKINNSAFDLYIQLDFFASNFDGENISPSIQINHIKFDNNEDFSNFNFHVDTVEEAAKREDLLYTFEHEPFVNYKLLINVKNDNYAHITLEGKAITDGYSTPYKQDKIIFDGDVLVKRD